MTIEQHNSTTVITQEKTSISEFSTKLLVLHERFKNVDLIIHLKEAALTSMAPLISLSAKHKIGVDTLQEKLLSFVNTGALRNNDTIVTNSRHYDSLLKALEEVQKVKYGIESNTSSDFIAIDIRQALYYFGEITGEVTNDELLGNIFANFCIGK